MTLSFRLNCLIILGCAQLVRASSIEIPAAGQIAYEIYDTTTTTFSAMDSLGSQSNLNGSNTFVGPTFAGISASFPYVQLVESLNFTVLHPGTFETLGTWAILSIYGLAPGSYVVDGKFARANNAFAAGDGVNVLVFTNQAVASPLFSAEIPSNYVVDVANVFDGSGVQSFNLTAILAAGDVLRFAVGPGSAGTNGTFDVTALQLSVSAEIPEPASALLVLLGAAAMAVMRNRTRLR